MTIKEHYFDLLDRLGSTITLREFHARQDLHNAVALRHDIDHDLDLALEMAHHEHARGVRATYFLLHTNEYWNGDQFEAKVRQLEAYGHEVGVHLNVLTEWTEGACDDPDDRIRQILVKLRRAGVDVTGVSAHGDRCCYERGFINYWLWRELRGEDPQRSESGKNAEGIGSTDPRWQVVYPTSHEVERGDGSRLALWRCSLAEHGLEYDAVHLPFDHYWSDSGGSWTRTADPMAADLSRGRHQVLVHPFWWRGPQRLFFVLSSARSGSKWLANFVERATSARGLHEWTLNHRRVDDDFIADKRTGDDYVGLLEDRPGSSMLIRQALTHHRQCKRDVLEANVYLEPFLPELRTLDAEAMIILLHRNGRDVVRSLLERNWYDTPADRRHRPIPVDEWDQLSQFERACWYWRHTNESIVPYATARWAFERMVSDLPWLQRTLNRLGIVVHPLLAEAEFPRQINASAERTVPPFEHWPPEYRERFDAICGHVQKLLEYRSDAVGAAPASLPASSAEQSIEARVVFDATGARVRRFASDVHVRLRMQGDEMLVASRRSGRANAHLLLAQGNWRRVEAEAGIPCSPDEWYRARLRWSAATAVQIRVFALFFDGAGCNIRAHHAGTLRGEGGESQFSFSSAPGASHFALALHFGGQDAECSVAIESLRVEATPINAGFRAVLSE